MSDLREYVKDRLARYPGVTCALHYDLRHWLMEHPDRPSDPATVGAHLRVIRPRYDAVLDSGPTEPTEGETDA